MNPIDHMRARALRDALDRAVPELEYVLSRWRGSAPRDVRQIEVPGIEHPDPISDDAFASMLDALDVLTADLPFQERDLSARLLTRERRLLATLFAVGDGHAL